MSPAVALPALQHQQACGEWGRRGQNGEGMGGESSIRTTQLCPFVLSPWGPQSPGEDTSPTVLMHRGGAHTESNGRWDFGGLIPSPETGGRSQSEGCRGGLPGVPTYIGRESAVNPYPLREVSGSPYPAPGGSTGVVPRPGRKRGGGKHPSRGEPSPPR